MFNTPMHRCVVLSSHLFHVIPLITLTILYIFYKPFCGHSNNVISRVQLWPKTDANYTQMVSTMNVRCEEFSAIETNYNYKAFYCRKLTYVEADLECHNIHFVLPYGSTLFQVQYLA